MTAEPRPSGPVGETLAALKRLPDFRAAIEGLLLFLMVVAAGACTANSGVLHLKPLPSDELLITWLSAFIVPTLSEEVLFRGWVRKGAPLAAFWPTFSGIPSRPGPACLLAARNSSTPPFSASSLGWA